MEADDDIDQDPVDGAPSAADARDGDGERAACSQQAIDLNSTGVDFACKPFSSGRGGDLRDYERDRIISCARERLLIPPLPSCFIQ